MRHEKKYRIENASVREVVQTILDHPASFRTAYPDRYINSIYFDSADLTTFQQNQDGISKRIKYRIRWYGEDLTKAEKPNLEIKIRDNQFGKKEIIALTDFDLNNPEELTKIASQHIPAELIPKIITRYQRAYFLSHNEILRATIDKDIAYYGFDKYSYKKTAALDSAIVLELKCDKEEVDYLTEASQHIPFRMVKNSKYVNGVFAQY